MRMPAQNKIVFLTLFFLLISLLGFGIWYFVFKSSSESSLGKEWGEYKDIYEYRKDEEDNVFWVDGYIVKKEMVLDNEEGNWVVDVIFYNKNISENLRKELLFSKDTGFELEEGLNYEFTFTRGVKKEIEIKSEYIDLSDKKEEYLWNLFVIMKRKQNQTYQDLEDMGVAMDKILELRKNEKDEDWTKVDPFSIYVSKELLKEEFLKEDQKSEINKFINFVEPKTDFGKTLFPCYVSKALDVSYMPTFNQYIDSLDLEEVTVEKLVTSLYYEEADRPDGNDDLRIFIDRMNFCKDLPTSKYQEEFNKIVNYLFTFANLDPESIILIKDSLIGLNDMGYKEIEVESLDQYVFITKYYDLNSVRVFSDCILRNCSVETIINKLPMSIKIEGKNLNITDSVDVYVNTLPSMLILSILNNE
jgi:hypothetical protein